MLRQEFDSHFILFFLIVFHLPSSVNPKKRSVRFHPTAWPLPINLGVKKITRLCPLWLKRWTVKRWGIFRSKTTRPAIFSGGICCSKFWKSFWDELQMLKFLGFWQVLPVKWWCINRIWKDIVLSFRTENLDCSLCYAKTWFFCPDSCNNLLYQSFTEMVINPKAGSQNIAKNIT